MRASRNWPASAVQESLSYEQYLLELAEQECQDATHEPDRAAGCENRDLPLEKSLARVRPEATAGEGGPAGADAAGRGFVDRTGERAGVRAAGQGKTHLLCAIAQELVRSGRKVLFSPCSLLVQELLVAKRDLKLSRYLKRLSGFEVLIIDDLGYVQQSREEMEVLFTLLAERYERGSVMITSNLPFSKWESIFKDPMTTAAAIDRLVHHSVILELNLPSYRLEQAKGASNQPPHQNRWTGTNG